MSRRVAVAIHWFLLAPLVVIPGVFAGPSKQHPKGLSDGNKWNAAPQNQKTPWEVGTSGLKTKPHKANLKPARRGQRSLLLDDDIENPLPVYPSPKKNSKAISTSGYEDVESSFSPVGSGYPNPGRSSNYISGLANSYSGVGDEYQYTGNSYMDSGNKYLGTGGGYIGTERGPPDTGYPDTRNWFPGSQTGYPQTPPQPGFVNPQSPYPVGGNPGNQWFPGSPNGYQSLNPGVPPFSPYYGNGNVTLTGNMPYGLSFNPVVSEIAAYSSSVNIPNVGYLGQLNGAFPGFSPYNGYEIPSVQAAPFGAIMNPQGYGLPGTNLLAYETLLPCQVLCCLLSLCHFYSLPPCSSCENVPGVQGQQPYVSSSRDASAPKVFHSGREVDSPNIVATPSKGMTAVTTNPDDGTPKPFTIARSLLSSTQDTGQKPSADLSQDTPKAPAPPENPSGSGGSSAVQSSTPLKDADIVVASGTLLSDEETQPQVKQPSAPTQEQSQTPAIAKSVRSLDPPPQPTSEKIEPRVVAGTRSLI